MRVLTFVLDETNSLEWLIVFYASKNNSLLNFEDLIIQSMTNNSYLLDIKKART